MTTTSPPQKKLQKYLEGRGILRNFEGKLYSPSRYAEASCPHRFLLLSLTSHGQVEKIAAFHEAAAINSGKIQQEMIYLHLDNTSYYRGDRLYFAGYLVTASRLTPSFMSRTVYVELLNPGGKIIDRCVLSPHLGRSAFLFTTA